MLVKRVVGAFAFRRGVYAEVVKDTTFTKTAWLLVLGAGFLGSLGVNTSQYVEGWFFDTSFYTFFVVIGFILFVMSIRVVGHGVFKADVTFDGLVRVLGLAFLWHVVGGIGVITYFFNSLAFLVSPAYLVGGILVLISCFIAAREALGLRWVQTIITTILGTIVTAILAIIFWEALGFFSVGAVFIIPHFLGLLPFSRESLLVRAISFYILALIVISVVVNNRFPKWVRIIVAIILSSIFLVFLVLGALFLLIRWP